MLKEIKIFTPTGIKTYIPEKITAKIIEENAVIRDTDVYRQAKDELIEKTMSCTPEETLRWFTVEAHDTLRNGTGEYDIVLRARFLAIYDLYEQVSANAAA